MNDLMRINLTQLANKDLAKSINKINTSVESGNKASWIIAEEFTRIVRDELFEDDFESETQFSKFVGISKATLSQFKSAVDFKENHSNIDTTVGKAYLFSTVEYWDDFESWVADNYEGAKPWEFSDKAVRELIKEYNKKDEVEAEEVEAESEESADEVEEAMNIMIEVADNEGIKYLVPLAVLNQYRIEVGA